MKQAKEHSANNLETIAMTSISTDHTPPAGGGPKEAVLPLPQPAGGAGVLRLASTTWPCEAPKVGIVLGMPSQAYHDDKSALGQSALKKIRISPAHFQHYIRHGQEETPRMRQGRVAHLFLLEPTRVGELIAVWGGDRRAGKAWEAFAGENGHKEIVTQPEYDLMLKLQDAWRSHPLAREIAATAAMVEASAFAQISGVRVKARPDLVSGGELFDLKVTDDASPEAFRRKAFHFGYHNQAAWYLDVMTRATGRIFDAFTFIVMERDAPHGIMFFEADAAFIARGRQENTENLELLKACTKRGAWPSFPAMRMPLSLPRWEQSREDDSWA